MKIRDVMTTGVLIAKRHEGLRSVVSIGDINRGLFFAMAD